MSSHDDRPILPGLPPRSVDERLAARAALLQRLDTKTEWGPVEEFFLARSSYARELLPRDGFSVWL